MSPIVVDDLVKEILTAKVYDVAIVSPLEKATKLSSSVGASVYLKREDLQPVHSFKLRGAYNKIANLSDEEKSKGVIAASAGNHAQGVALAAKKLGLSALIIMPKTTPSIKIEAVRSYGAEVELAGDSYSDAAEYCKQRVIDTGRTYIHPFDDPLVIAGQGTIGREIVDQLSGVTHIFVPVGGGGLMAGIASYVKALRPDIELIGVQAEDASTLSPSLKQKKRVVLSHVGIFADGTAVKQLGERTFRAMSAYVDQSVTVTTDQLCAAIKAVFEDTRSIVEPSGALAVAGIMQYKLPNGSNAVAICSGANITFERLEQIAERTLIGSGKEALFEVEMPETPGALQTFCNKVVRQRSITEFAYRLRERSGAHVLVGIGVTGAEDRTKLSKTMQSAGYNHSDLTTDDVAKEHVRHMIGGASVSKDEHVYNVTFPERPGALADFLLTMGSRYNISLFHYRSMASDNGSVFIGFESDSRKTLEEYLDRTGYEYKLVDNDLSVKTFLK